MFIFGVEQVVNSVQETADGYAGEEVESRRLGFSFCEVGLEGPGEWDFGFYFGDSALREM